MRKGLYVITIFDHTVKNSRGEEVDLPVLAKNGCKACRGLGHEGRDRIQDKYIPCDCLIKSPANIRWIIF